MLLINVPHGVRLNALNLQTVMTFEINFTPIDFNGGEENEIVGSFLLRN